MDADAGLSQPDPRPASSEWWAIALVLLVIGLTLLWPGDVPWQTDEPRLLAQAWHSNHDHVLEASGQYGNFGVPYGPLPIWIYQGLLLLTHDPVWLVFWRSLLCAGGTAFALLWLGRTLRLPAWFAAAILVTPYVTAFHRILWDASFDLPLGAFAVAAFADFCATQRARSLRVCVICTALLPIIHPQALPLSGALAIYLLWKKRSDFWHDRRALIIIALILLGLHAAYIPRAIGALVWRMTHGTTVVYPGQGSRLLSACAPFLGGHLLDGSAYAENVAPPQAPEALVVGAKWLSHLIYPLLWMGIGLAAFRTRAAFRSKASHEPLLPHDELSVVLTGCVILQVLLFAALRIPPGPQYFFGVFAAQVCLAWLAVGVPCCRRLGLTLGILFAGGSFFLTVSSTLASHDHGFAPAGWLQLKNCVAVAQDLNRFSDPTAQTDVEFLQRSPQTLRTLRLLLPPTQPGTKSSGLQLALRPSTRESGQELTLVELDHGVAAPAGSQPLDVTPLPKDWVPDPSTW